MSAISQSSVKEEALTGVFKVTTVAADGRKSEEWAYLAKDQRGAARPQVDTSAEQTAPAFRGSVDEYVAARGAECGARGLDLAAEMKNRVRVCDCGKAVAYTLPTCNLCGAPIQHKPISLVDNVFTGFIFGIERCKAFPLTISVRKQTPALLVFDDILSLAPCHLNVIPTDRYVPDWRFLLRRPAASLALVRALAAAAKDVVRTAFLGNPAWRAATYRDGCGTTQDILDATVMGLNFPPSQYQLHLQVIVPPMIPYQYYLYLRGTHYTKGRFFPYAYVTAALEAIVAQGKEDAFADVGYDTPIEDVVARIAALGVSYDDHHKALYEHVERAQKRFGNWRADDFAGYGLADKIYAWGENEPLAGADPKAVQTADKLALQGYGRPYTPQGKPSGTFYKFAKTPFDVESWV